MPVILGRERRALDPGGDLGCAFPGCRRLRRRRHCWPVNPFAGFALDGHLLRHELRYFLFLAATSHALTVTGSLEVDDRRHLRLRRRGEDYRPTSVNSVAAEGV